MQQFTEHIKDYKKRVFEQINALKKQDKTSTVFSEFERHYQEAVARADEEEERVKAEVVKETPQDKLGDQLGAAISITHDEAKIQEILNNLPSQITSKRLAFNVACAYSRKKNKENMLKFIKLAKSLGQEGWNFETDADFKPWLQDSDFRAAIKD